MSAPNCKYSAQLNCFETHPPLPAELSPLDKTSQRKQADTNQKDVIFKLTILHLAAKSFQIHSALSVSNPTEPVLYSQRAKVEKRT